MFAYLLEGELTVDHGSDGKRVYAAGDALMEAMSVDHAGRNTGAGLMRILIVYMGASDGRNVIADQ
jgi:quercetin dioxygenase-like cupin family protein